MTDHGNGHASFAAGPGAPANPMKGGQAHDGPKKVCGAKTRKGTPCQEDKLFPNGRCYRHGGPSPKGAASPHFKHGKHSRYYPRGLQRLIEQAAADPDLLRLHKEAAELDGMKGAAFRAMEKPAPPWKKAIKLCRVLKGELASVEGLARTTVRTLENLAALLEQGADAAEAWRRGWAEVKDLIARKTVVAAAEHKRAHDAANVVTAEQFGVWVEAVIAAARKIVLSVNEPMYGR
jgi:hypothetical protein